jgi:hypothetical protein
MHYLRALPSAEAAEAAEARRCISSQSRLRRFSKYSSGFIFVVEKKLLR